MFSRQNKTRNKKTIPFKGAAAAAEAAAGPPAQPPLPPPPPPAPLIFSFSVNLGFGGDPFAPLGYDAPFIDEAEDNKPEGDSGIAAVLFTIRIFWGGLVNGREADDGGGGGAFVVVLELGWGLVDWAFAPPVGGGCWTWSLSFRGWDRETRS